MALKHFKDYYKNISSAYMQQNILLNKMVEEYEAGRVDEERLEMFRNNMTPIQNNFASLSYIKMLLELPLSEKKIERMSKKNQALLAKIDPGAEMSPEQMIKDNEAALQRLKDLTE